MNQGALGFPIAPAGAVPYVCVQDQKANPSDGGTFTAGAWRTRTLTTISVDSAGIATLAASQIALPPGTYRCSISCPAYEVGANVSRLQNISTGTTLVRGTMEFAGPAVSVGNTRSWIIGMFTLYAASVLEVQHWANATKATIGFGVGSTGGGAVDGGPDIYTVAEFHKVG